MMFGTWQPQRKDSSEWIEPLLSKVVLPELCLFSPYYFTSFSLDRFAIFKKTFLPSELHITGLLLHSPVPWRRERRGNSRYNHLMEGAAIVSEGKKKYVITCPNNCPPVLCCAVEKGCDLGESANDSAEVAKRHVSMYQVLDSKKREVSKAILG